MSGNDDNALLTPPEGVDPAQAAEAEAEAAVASLPQAGDRFEVLGAVGEAGKSHTFRALDRRFQKIVAIRRVPPKAPPAAIIRFVRGARAATGVRHPALLAVYGAARDPEGPFVVVDLIDGGDLAARIARAGPYSMEAAAGIFAKLADALAQAHAQGVVHGGVRPSNILIDKTGTIFLSDLAVARDPERDPSGSVSSSSMNVYLAPEQVLGGHKVDDRTDVFSLAKTLYFALTGEHPTGLVFERLPAPIREPLKKALRAPGAGRVSMVELRDDLEKIAASGRGSTSAMRMGADAGVGTRIRIADELTAAAIEDQNRALEDAKKTVAESVRRRREMDIQRAERVAEEWKTIERERAVRGWRKVIASLKLLEQLTPDDPRLPPLKEEAQRAFDKAQRHLDAAEEALKTGNIRAALSLAASIDIEGGSAAAAERFLAKAKETEAAKARLERTIELERKAGRWPQVVQAYRELLALFPKSETLGADLEDALSMTAAGRAKRAQIAVGVAVVALLAAALIFVVFESYQRASWLDRVEQEIAKGDAREALRMLDADGRRMGYDQTTLAPFYDRARLDLLRYQADALAKSGAHAEAARVYLEAKALAVKLGLSAAPFDAGIDDQRYLAEIRMARAAIADGQPDMARRALESAVSLARGDPTKLATIDQLRGQLTD
jgi:serine/threonine protein kinase